MHIILIKFVSQMEHYLTIWFNTGNLYLLNFSFARKSFYRKTIPLIKNFTFARIFKTMQINNSVFRIFPYSMVQCCIFHLNLIKVISFHHLYKVLIIFLFYKNINIVMGS